MANICVNVKDYDTLDEALKVFKRKFITEGVMQEIQKHSEWETKGQKRRRKKKAAQRKIMIAQKRKQRVRYY